jgi:hypothetical protein
MSSVMQTFRASIRDAAGTITWAAWIEASSLAEANGMAARMLPERPRTVELWCAASRDLPSGSVLEAV